MSSLLKKFTSFVHLSDLLSCPFIYIDIFEFMIVEKALLGGQCRICDEMRAFRLPNSPSLGASGTNTLVKLKKCN